MKKFYLSLAMLACFAASLAFVHVASAAAITLSATVNTTGAQPSVVLQWTDLGRDTRYDVYRDYQKECSQTTNTLTDTPTGTGQTHDYCIYATGGRGQAMVVSNHVTVNFSSGVVSAPTGLSAEPMWVASCPLCNGMAMAHIVLTWTPVPSATAYNVFRNGTLLQSNLSTPTDTDMTVVSGQSYTYAVSAVTPSGVTPQSAPATATAPEPPTEAPVLTPPTNLAVQGLWQGAGTDVLSWDSVPSAVTYNVYQYGTPIAAGLTGTSYIVPFNIFASGATYTVTAVDRMGMESIPSNVVTASGAFDPNNIPSWVPAYWAPTAPDTLVATPDWNNGAPRIALTWRHSGDYYNVYRDGQEIASGIWGLAYYDTHISPGSTHTYSVAGYNNYLANSETAHSTPVVATALTVAPTTLPGKVQITNVLPDDDSVKVFFNAIPGAVDYRIFDVSNPGVVKYAGRNEPVQSSDMAKNGFAPLPAVTTLSIEMNGLNPTTGADLVVQAVDKLGPFQTSDGMMGPGTTTMSGMVNVAINGQGDPSNVPNVLATSDVFHVTCQPRILTGGQVFFDNFRDDTPFTPSTPEAPVAALSNYWYQIQEQQNDKWRIRTYGADNANTRAFIMSNHFMDTLYDGPTGGHNNNASLVMIPKATADISGGKVLHVTFEVDAHFDGRRWCDVFVGEAGDPLLNSTPTKISDTQLPTVKGNLFEWQMDGGHTVQLVEPQPQSDGSINNVAIDLTQVSDWTDGFSLRRDVYRQVWQNMPYPNGSVLNLDKRSRFDLYLSQNHYKIVETEPDGVTQLVREKDFPAGVTLPFTKCQVYFVHEVYHTGNDRAENVQDAPEEAYWYNYRPWSDERHWDDMGFEVLNAFPSP